MGAITPVLTTLTTLTSAVGAVNTAVGAIQTLSGNSAQDRSDDLALEQLQARQRLEQSQLSQDNALERERIALAAAQDDEDRRAALKRAVARQRASFGSSGISQGSGGSANAVLLGLFDETEDELNNREALDNLRSRALDLDASQTRSLNVLQATQLRERQNLNSLF